MKSFCCVPLLAIVFLLFQLAPTKTFSQDTEEDRSIYFPDIPGYKTLVCDLHMHTVFSDGDVWPAIRVQEAIRDGLDVISITDHLEYQPHQKDLPHPDRNRPYQLAIEAAGNSDLIVINGAEITRSMPPGHFNALFVKDVNALNQEDAMEVFREAKRQGAFVFWNHPHWTAQKPDGVAKLTDFHFRLLEEELFSGIEIYNHTTYSDEALDIAGSYELTVLGTSDIHGLIDWQYQLEKGAHRPVTLAFASERSPESVKQALLERRTVVWFDQTLVGDEAFLVPLINQSLQVTRQHGQLVENIDIENHSDSDFILENHSDFTFHNHPQVLVLKAHETRTIQVKTIQKLKKFELRFKVLNAFVSPDQHPLINLYIE